MTTAKLLDGSPTSGGKDYTQQGRGQRRLRELRREPDDRCRRRQSGRDRHRLSRQQHRRHPRRPRERAAGQRRHRHLDAAQVARSGPAAARGTCKASPPASRSPIPNTASRSTTCSLSGQRDIGLANDGNAVAAADLTIDASATAIANRAPGGLISLTKAVLRRERRGCDGPGQPRHRRGPWRDARRVCAAGRRRRTVGRRVAGRAVAARNTHRRT